MVQHNEMTEVEFLDMKLHQGPLDNWSNRERLALACSVKKSGDQNWVSVSRAIKPYGEPSRPAEWFSQKNCALQYTDMLEKVETPKRKRGEHGELETTQNQIARKLTIERIEELKRLVVEEQKCYKALKKEVEMIKSGQWDDKLKEIWEQKQGSKKETEVVKPSDVPVQQTSPGIKQTDGSVKTKKPHPKPLLIPTKSGEQVKETAPVDSSVPENTQAADNPIVSEDQTTPTKILVTSTDTQDAPTGQGDQKPRPTPPPSPLLSSLLQSQATSLFGLQQIKQEAEQEHAQKAKEMLGGGDNLGIQTPEVTPTPSLPVTPTEIVQPSPSSAAPTLTKLLHLPSVQNKPATLDPLPTSPAEEIPDLIKIEVKKEILDVEEVIETTGILMDITNEVEVETVTPKTESPEKSSVDQPENSAAEDELDLPETPSDTAFGEEPASPASSVSSPMSEGGSREDGGKEEDPKDRDDNSSKQSDVDTSDDETVRESDDTLSLSASQITAPCGGALSESIPNSPLSHCSDTEDEKAYKTWKKSIMLVWRAAATHKYANVFLHPVTEDIAPGYHGIVHKPMDLSTIKKYIENGRLRTTTEFQRDMMLMFTNAVMYNSSNHNVYKMAVVMYEDVMHHIEQYVNTQLMVQSNETKMLRPLRRSEKSESSDKEEELKRKRTSIDTSMEGGKTKKRKTRADDT
ncbi:hypothetical protein ScPMuIL_006967 [Solemya velum]